MSEQMLGGPAIIESEESRLSGDCLLGTIQEDMNVVWPHGGHSSAPARAEWFDLGAVLEEDDEFFGSNP